MANVDFDPFSREFFDDPFATYARMREEAPCFHSDRWDFYAFSRFADIVAVHLDTENFTSTHGLTYEHLSDPNFDPGINRSMIMMDPPEHNRYRRLVSRSFTPRAMADYRHKVQVLIRSYLDPLMDRDGFDMVEDFAAPFPVEIICAILGVPEADRQMIRLQTDAMLHREEGQSEASPAQIEAAIGQAVYFLDFVAAKRKRPAEDMCSALIEARVETEDGDLVSLTDDEIAGFCSLLGAAGSETVTKALGNATVLFHRNPAEWQKVCDDPSKIDNAVEEVLRYWAPSQYQGRLSVNETQWHGVRVPPGKPVFLVTGAANHDPREFVDPEVFDIGRRQRLALSFGHGIHVCIGAALARMECAVALEEIRNRWPDFTVVEDGLERVQMSNVAGFSRVPVIV
ncbi:MAG: cytochrome P450 [Actinomycetota bacterium]|nr:cytochrome P450 [Acidimicrobiales bacterium]MEC8953165.1 cytochrome P450 [Actinomycetota bacterium]GIT76298.1 MAG: cytochrome P450 [Acidimicrobiaceae bacterium]MED5232784.1 cytochrome P450 [Actinomycetota bacterium]MED5394965.1 cytochrome P450 [Actinomycetota bacterium]